MDPSTEILHEDVRDKRASALLDRLNRLDAVQRASVLGALDALEALVEDV